MKTTIAFTIVAIAPYKNCKRILELFNTSLKSPKTKPRIVRKSAFNPSGEALKKSKRNPDTNPVVSPKIIPLFKETNKVIINKKSGTTGR